MSNPNQLKSDKLSSSFNKDNKKNSKDKPKCDKCSGSSKIYKFSCPHSFCLECLYNYSISTNFSGMTNTNMLFTCQICQEGNASFDNDSWINVLNELINQKNEKNKTLEVKEANTKKKCSQHQDQPITSYCGYCKLWLCEECKALFHNNYYPEHILSDNEEIDIFCKNHTDTIIDYYCLKCQKDICHFCLGKGNEHYLHRYLTKVENDKIRKQTENKNSNSLSYHSYAEFEEGFNKIEQNFFGQIENDFILKKTKIEELIKSLQQLEDDYMNQMQNFQIEMTKIFQIIKLSYFNYFATDEKKRNQDITLANSLTDITLLSSKKVEVNDMCRDFNNQLNEFNNKNENKSSLSYEIIWDNSQIEKESTLIQPPDQTDNSNGKTAHSEGVTKVIELNKIGCLATASIDASINIWDIDSYQFLYNLSEHKSSIWSLYEHSDGSLISGSSDKTIKVWFVTKDSGLSQNTLIGHKGTVYAITELKDGTIVSGSEDKTLKIWNINKKQCLFTLTDTFAINSLATLVDDLVVSGGTSNNIKLWNIKEKSCVGELPGHGCTVWCIAPFEDGLQIVSGSSDNTIKIWGLNEWKCIGTLEGHENSISSVRIMKNNLLLSASWDFSVKFWNLSTHLCIFTIREHRGIVFDVIELSNGKIVSASKDKSVIVWKKN